MLGVSLVWVDFAGTEQKCYLPEQSVQKHWEPKRVGCVSLALGSKPYRRSYVVPFRNCYVFATRLSETTQKDLLGRFSVVSGVLALAAVAFSRE